MSGIEDILGYRFSNKELLKEALTHPSCNEMVDGRPFHYQRLEFLGDSIIGAVISELLYSSYPDEPEGNLAKRKAALVSSHTISRIVEDHHIFPFIRLSASEKQDGGQSNRSIQEDVCEALMGAIYLDGGYEKVREVILQIWQPYSDKLTSVPQDAKTTLQEWAQGKGLSLPLYEVISEEGPAHAPKFEIRVTVQGYPPEIATAGNKRKAEQQAAAQLLKKL